MAAENTAENTFEEQKPKRRRGRWRKRASESEYSGDAGTTTESKGRITPSTHIRSGSSGNLVTRPFIQLAEALKDVQSEVRKVTWPTRPETARLTRIVIITTIISSIFLGVFALLWNNVVRIGLNSPIILFALFAFAIVIASVMIRRGSSAG